MYAVVLFKDGEAIGAVSKEGNAFVICHLFKDEVSATKYGMDVHKVVGYSFKVFKEAEG